MGSLGKVKSVLFEKVHGDGLYSKEWEIRLKKKKSNQARVLIRELRCLLLYVSMLMTVVGFQMQCTFLKPVIKLPFSFLPSQGKGHSTDSF